MLQSCRLRKCQIFNVTIRDGSYTIDFQFTPDDIRQMLPGIKRADFEATSRLVTASVSTVQPSAGLGRQRRRNARRGHRTIHQARSARSSFLASARRSTAAGSPRLRHAFVRIGDDGKEL